MILFCTSPRKLRVAAFSPFNCRATLSLSAFISAIMSMCSSPGEDCTGDQTKRAPYSKQILSQRPMAKIGNEKELKTAVLWLRELGLFPIGQSHKLIQNFL